MIDSFVFLAPLLLLGVMALVGFVGCDIVFGLDEVRDPLPAPVITATAGNRSVTVTWEDYPGATEFHVARGTTMGGPYPDTHTVALSEIPYVDQNLINGTQYCYIVKAKTANGESSQSNESCATPAATGQFTPFVDQPPALGTLHSLDAGFFGMKIVVGSNPINVEQLGRYFIPGNGRIHEMRIVHAATQQMVPNSQVMVDITKGNPNEFVYEAVTGPVTLMPGQEYYIVSAEQIGMDQYCLDDTVVHTTGVASIPSAASGDGTNFTTTGGMNNSYGPVSFSYS
ncbi:MAG TPA: hypothetical protein VM099_03745 [Gemmatimonadaceae bacterium]|nr:hypothetical protein [Gemmatimonadaceae bacterium]